MPDNLIDAEREAMEAMIAANAAAEDARASRVKRVETPMEKARRTSVENASKKRRSRRAMANASRRKNR